MVVKSLKKVDIVLLESELSGLTDPQSKEVKIRGILNEKLSLAVKYALTELLEKVQKVKEEVETTRIELLKKFGSETENGDMSIAIFEGEPDPESKSPRKFTEAFENYKREIDAKLEEVVDIEYSDSVQLTEFANVQSEYNYPTFYKLM